MAQSQAAAGSAVDHLHQLRARLHNDYTYHPPGAADVQVYAAVRKRFLELTLWLVEVVPDSRELSVALTHLELANLEANAGIERNPQP